MKKNEIRFLLCVGFKKAQERHKENARINPTLTYYQNSLDSLEYVRKAYSKYEEYCLYLDLEPLTLVQWLKSKP